jgi:hypothetical protein
MKTSSPLYRWKITRDFLYENDPDCYEDSDVGVEGPHNCDPDLKTNPTPFHMYDDDGHCYYAGMLYGDFEGLEPLWDFGMPNAGCTSVKINGKTI